MEILDRYGFILHESAQAAGIDFVHQPPGIDARLAHVGPQIAAMGAAAAVVDFDQDGWLDLYVTNSAPGSQNRLYRNRHDGSFEDVAAERGLADLNRPGTGACMGSVWADMDNDGFEDVLVYKWGRTELFRNRGGQTFECVTQTAGLPAWANIGAATWLDYDRDGLVDLFLAGYWADDVHLEQLEDTQIMPESFEYANNGGENGCCATSVRAALPMSPSLWGSLARGGRWPSSRRTSTVTALLTCSFQMTTVCRNFLSTSKVSLFGKWAKTAASVTLRRVV